jgi:hypothetical protein
MKQITSPGHLDSGENSSSLPPVRSAFQDQLQRAQGARKCKLSFANGRSQRFAVWLRSAVNQRAGRAANLTRPLSTPTTKSTASVASVSLMCSARDVRN